MCFRCFYDEFKNKIEIFGDLSSNIQVQGEGANAYFFYFLFFSSFPIDEICLENKKIAASCRINLQM
jgi:hypothetical protein